MRLIHLAVEDDLSHALSFRLLRTSQNQYEVYHTLGRQGRGYLESKITEINRAARHIAFFVLIDLDRDNCAPQSLVTLLPNGKSQGLILRYAVRASESWVLADRHGFTSLLGIPLNKIPMNTDMIADPKQFLLSAAKLSRRSQLKEELLPPHGSTARVGPNYNGVLTEFVAKNWNIEEAVCHSESLRSAVDALDTFSFNPECP